MDQRKKHARAKRIFQNENKRELKQLADQVRKVREENQNPLLQKRALEEKLFLVRKHAEHKRELQNLQKFLKDEQDRREKIKSLRAELKRDRALSDLLRSEAEQKLLAESQQTQVTLLDQPSGSSLEDEPSEKP